MNHRHICVTFTLFLLVSTVVSNIAVDMVTSIGHVTYCRYYECCTDAWIPADYAGLKKALEDKIYGQQLAVDVVVKHLEAHRNDNPRKALVLSLHGWPGTGKNYVSNIVAKMLYKEGMNSKYVHLIAATKDFQHKDHVSLYKDTLREIIETGLKGCDRSLFIIDEMDKMQPGIIDTLKPYLDFYHNVNGVDPRRATFFFLSNTAGNDIADRMISHWRNGVDRERVTLKEMEQIIFRPSLNENGGLWHSELLSKHLITAYVPFLPLERSHVKECIRSALVDRGFYHFKDSIDEEIVQEIADELQYYPVDAQIFSTSGCKRVIDKIYFVLGK